MNNQRGSRRALVLLLLVVAGYRLSLLGRGAMAFVDEQWYYKSGLALERVRAGDLRGALGEIASSNARPGFAIAELPVAALQAIPYAFGISPSNPRSLLIPTAFNVVVSIVILYLFFEICASLCGDSGVALIMSVLYALLTNSNLYVRHLLPYDLAMCAIVLAVWLEVTCEPTARLAAATGALTAAAIAIYPGYYLAAVIPGVAVVGLIGSGGTTRLARASACVASAFGVIVATELLCRAGGLSYLASARDLSRTITQGAYEEGGTFLPAYLVGVERFSGVALLIGSAIYVWGAAGRLARLTPRPIDWLGLPALAAAIWQAANSSLLHDMVLYGRLIHPWMFFMSLALADTLARIGGRQVRAVACAIVCACAIVSWAPATFRYYQLAYPADVLYAQGIDTKRVPPDRMLCEFDDAIPYQSPAPLNRETGFPYTDASEGDLLLNFCQGLPSASHRAADIAASSPVFDGPHFLTFPAYGFEGFAAAAREALREHGYRVRVFHP